ncbi:hypothetical protein TrVE_jg12246 [Triparma verrucosa]|uniref:Uncharacterized protein n=2 Tax=Triparma TaxID=722752 RepID=A0A9W7EX38_9STRA|nr:hypothetical protein TrST_g12686 [Triparma strigata]GMI05092.1 hypothetical protein TrVE_jg12246 [Triparma verrucosa]|eukprot:CAMPEP_0182491798 /NCGR_PEP_ID=MMETSP1321-20130603/1110_1 /TAXON_ID=91990 /ORGANISM="Bolidomonas sp., Strain RCC1657" /LENGTH=175 /DNA_ID=CAMNT_0024694133 /DNA_START=24 /DNA_END=551 /DNA_ORIENTATION=+
MSFEPAWANPGAPAPAAPQQPQYGTQPTIQVPANAGTVQNLLSLFNMGLAVMMSASGVLGIAKNSGFSADIFVALYMILFGVLLFTYELMWWKTIDSVTRVLRKNFGFLFGIKGKSFFLIFIAFLNFGLNSAGEPAKTLGMATGICLLIDGILHFGIMLKYPEYVQYTPPQVSAR